MRKIVLGQVWGVEVTAEVSALIGSVLLWVGHTALAYGVLQAPLDEALTAGFLAVPLYWLGEFLHQLGHAWVAARVGYPMKGMRFSWVLIRSWYPRDEPNLPARTHIERALGGPPVSLTLAMVALVIVLLVSNVLSGPFWWVSLLFFIQNFFIFFLGAFLPLGFTDGSTLLKYLRQQ